MRFEWIFAARLTMRCSEPLLNVMTLIEVRSHRWGWQVFESPGVEPVFLQKDQAIGYAETRARLRTGEIRIFDSTGKVERVIAFDDANRRL